MSKSDVHLGTGFKLQLRAVGTVIVRMIWNFEDEILAWMLTECISPIFHFRDLGSGQFSARPIITLWRNYFSANNFGTSGGRRLKVISKRSFPIATGRQEAPADHFSLVCPDEKTITKYTFQYSSSECLRWGVSITDVSCQTFVPIISWDISSTTFRPVRYFSSRRQVFFGP